MPIRDILAYIPYAVSITFILKSLRSWLKNHKDCLHALVDCITDDESTSETIEEENEEEAVEEVEEAEEEKQEENVAEEAEEEEIEQPKQQLPIAKEQTKEQLLTPIEAAIKHIEQNHKIAKKTDKNDRTLIELENGEILTIKPCSGPDKSRATVTKEKLTRNGRKLIMKTYRDAEGNPTAIYSHYSADMTCPKLCGMLNGYDFI